MKNIRLNRSFLNALLLPIMLCATVKSSFSQSGDISAKQPAKYRVLLGTVDKVTAKEDSGYPRGKATITTVTDLLTASPKQAEDLPYSALNDAFQGGSLFLPIWPPENLVEKRKVVALVTYGEDTTDMKSDRYEKVESLIVVPQGTVSTFQSIISLETAKAFYSDPEVASLSEARRLGYMQTLHVLLNSPEQALEVLEYLNNLSDEVSAKSTFEMSFENLPGWYKVTAGNDPLIWEKRDREFVTKRVIMSLVKNNSPLVPRAFRLLKRDLQGSSDFKKSEVVDRLKLEGKKMGPQAVKQVESNLDGL
jgi:hypothetical protein